ncbi:MAG: sterol desaturase family protein [Pseudomonadota bacterium]
MFDTLVEIASWPVQLVWAQVAVSPSSRYFWPYIVGGAMIACFAWRFGRATFYTEAKKPAYWLGASARVDYAHVVLNPIIKILLFTGLITAAGALGQNAIGAAPPKPHAWAYAAALTLALFVADDFMRFFTHWLMHKVPIFWSFHRVHHAAESMTFATADRSHFAEMAFVTLPLVMTYAVVNAAFIVFTGIETQPFAVAGANIFLVAFNVVGGAFRHAPMWVSFGPMLERWLISPAMHHVHHSARPIHFDKNMGGTLAIWDRLFGTHYIPAGAHELSRGVGLGSDGKALKSVAGALLEPFGHAVRTLMPHRNTSNPNAGRPS